MDIPLPGECASPLPPGDEEYTRLLPPPPLPKGLLRGSESPPGLDDFESFIDSNKYSPSHVTAEEDIQPSPVPSPKSTSAPGITRAAVLGKAQAKRRLMAFSASQKFSKKTTAEAAGGKDTPGEIPDGKEEKKKKVKKKLPARVEKERAIIASIEQLKREEESIRAAHGFGFYDSPYVTSKSSLTPLLARSKDELDVNSKIRDGETLTDGENEKLAKDDGPMSESKGKSRSDRRRNSRDRGRDKDKDRDRNKDSREDRQRSKEKQRRPTELPVNWAQFKSENYSFSDVTHLKYKLEDKSQRSRERERRRHRDRSSRSREERKHRRSPYKEDMKNAVEEPKEFIYKLFQHPPKPIFPYIAKNIEGLPKEYPRVLLKLTKTQPNITYSENPKTAKYYRNRKEMFAESSQEIVELMKIIIENRTDKFRTKLYDNDDVKPSSLAALQVSYDEGEDNLSSDEISSGKRRERQWFLPESEWFVIVPENDSVGIEEVIESSEKSQSKEGEEGFEKSLSKENKISEDAMLVDSNDILKSPYEDNKIENETILESATSLRVRSKWDSDYEEDHASVESSHTPIKNAIHNDDIPSVSPVPKAETESKTSLITEEDTLVDSNENSNVASEASDIKLFETGEDNMELSEGEAEGNVILEERMNEQGTSAVAATGDSVTSSVFGIVEVPNSSEASNINEGAADFKLVSEYEEFIKAVSCDTTDESDRGLNTSNSTQNENIGTENTDLETNAGNMQNMMMEWDRDVEEFMNGSNTRQAGRGNIFPISENSTFSMNGNTCAVNGNDTFILNENSISSVNESSTIEDTGSNIFRGEEYNQNAARGEQISPRHDLVFESVIEKKGIQKKKNSKYEHVASNNTSKLISDIREFDEIRTNSSIDDAKYRYSDRLSMEEDTFCQEMQESGESDDAKSDDDNNEAEKTDSDGAESDDEFETSKHDGKTQRMFLAHIGKMTQKDIEQVLQKRGQEVHRKRKKMSKKKHHKAHSKRRRSESSSSDESSSDSETDDDKKDKKKKAKKRKKRRKRRKRYSSSDSDDSTSSSTTTSSSSSSSTESSDSSSSDDEKSKERKKKKKKKSKKSKKHSKKHKKEKQDEKKIQKKGKDKSEMDELENQNTRRSKNKIDKEENIKIKKSKHKKTDKRKRKKLKNKSERNSSEKSMKNSERETLIFVEEDVDKNSENKIKSGKVFDDIVKNRTLKSDSDEPVRKQSKNDKNKNNSSDKHSRKSSHKQKKDSDTEGKQKCKVECISENINENLRKSSRTDKSSSKSKHSVTADSKMQHVKTAIDPKESISCEERPKLPLMEKESEVKNRNKNVEIKDYKNKLKKSENERSFESKLADLNRPLKTSKSVVAKSNDKSSNILEQESRDKSDEASRIESKRSKRNYKPKKHKDRSASESSNNEIDQENSAEGVKIKECSKNISKYNTDKNEFEEHTSRNGDEAVILNKNSHSPKSEIHHAEETRSKRLSRRESTKSKHDKNSSQVKHTFSRRESNVVDSEGDDNLENEAIDRLVATTGNRRFRDRTDSRHTSLEINEKSNHDYVVLADSSRVNYEKTITEKKGSGPNKTQESTFDLVSSSKKISERNHRSRTNEYSVKSEKLVYVEAEKDYYDKDGSFIEHNLKDLDLEKVSKHKKKTKKKKKGDDDREERIENVKKSDTDSDNDKSDKKRHRNRSHSSPIKKRVRHSSTTSSEHSPSTQKQSITESKISCSPKKSNSDHENKTKMQHDNSSKKKKNHKQRQENDRNSVEDTQSDCDQIKTGREKKSHDYDDSGKKRTHKHWRQEDVKDDRQKIQLDSNQVLTYDDCEQESRSYNHSNSEKKRTYRRRKEEYYENIEKSLIDFDENEWKSVHHDKNEKKSVYKHNRDESVEIDQSDLIEAITFEKSSNEHSEKNRIHRQGRKTVIEDTDKEIQSDSDQIETSQSREREIFCNEKREDKRSNRHKRGESEGKDEVQSDSEEIGISKNQERENFCNEKREDKRSNRYRREESEDRDERVQSASEQIRTSKKNREKYHEKREGKRSRRYRREEESEDMSDKAGSDREKNKRHRELRRKRKKKKYRSRKKYYEKRKDNKLSSDSETRENINEEDDTADENNFDPNLNIKQEVFSEEEYFNDFPPEDYDLSLVKSEVTDILEGENTDSVEKSLSNSENTASVEKSLSNSENTASVEKSLSNSENSASVEKSLSNSENSASVIKSLSNSENSASVEKSLSNISEPVCGSLNSLQNFETIVHNNSCITDENSNTNKTDEAADCDALKFANNGNKFVKETIFESSSPTENLSNITEKVSAELTSDNVTEVYKTSLPMQTSLLYSPNEDSNSGNCIADNYVEFSAAKFDETSHSEAHQNQNNRELAIKEVESFEKKDNFTSDITCQNISSHANAAVDCLSVQPVSNVLLDSAEQAVAIVKSDCNLNSPKQLIPDLNTEKPDSSDTSTCSVAPLPSVTPSYKIKLLPQKFLSKKPITIKLPSQDLLMQSQALHTSEIGGNSSSVSNISSSAVVTSAITPASKISPCDITSDFQSQKLTENRQNKWKAIGVCSGETYPVTPEDSQVSSSTAKAESKLTSNDSSSSHTGVEHVSSTGNTLIRKRPSRWGMTTAPPKKISGDLKIYADNVKANSVLNKSDLEERKSVAITSDSDTVTKIVVSGPCKDTSVADDVVTTYESMKEASMLEEQKNTLKENFKSVEEGDCGKEDITGLVAFKTAKNVCTKDSDEKVIDIIRDNAGQPDGDFNVPEQHIESLKHEDKHSKKSCNLSEDLRYTQRESNKRHRNEHSSRSREHDKEDKYEEFSKDDKYKDRDRDSKCKEYERERNRNDYSKRYEERGRRRSKERDRDYQRDRRRGSETSRDQDRSRSRDTRKDTFEQEADKNRDSKSKHMVRDSGDQDRSEQNDKNRDSYDYRTKGKSKLDERTRSRSESDEYQKHGKDISERKKNDAGCRSYKEEVQSVSTSQSPVRPSSFEYKHSSSKSCESKRVIEKSETNDVKTNNNMQLESVSTELSYIPSDTFYEEQPHDRIVHYKAESDLQGWNDRYEQDHGFLYDEKGNYSYKEKESYSFEERSKEKNKFTYGEEDNVYRDKDRYPYKEEENYSYIEREKLSFREEVSATGNIDVQGRNYNDNRNVRYKDDLSERNDNRDSRHYDSTLSQAPYCYEKPLLRKSPSVSPRRGPSPKRKPMSPLRRSRSPTPKQSRSNSYRWSSSSPRRPSPGRQQSRSPIRRSRSPMYKQTIRSPRRRSRTPVRKWSTSPSRKWDHKFRSRSRSPVRRRQPSPRRNYRSPLRKHNRSPVRRYTPSPRRYSRSPVRKYSRSPRRYSRSPDVKRSRSPAVKDGTSRHVISPVTRRNSFSKRSVSPYEKTRRSSVSVRDSGRRESSPCTSRKEIDFSRTSRRSYSHSPVNAGYSSNICHRSPRNASPQGGIKKGPRYSRSPSPVKSYRRDSFQRDKRSQSPRVPSHSPSPFLKHNDCTLKPGSSKHTLDSSAEPFSKLPSEDNLATRNRTSYISKTSNSPNSKTLSKLDGDKSMPVSQSSSAFVSLGKENLLSSMNIGNNLEVIVGHSAVLGNETHIQKHTVKESQGSSLPPKDTSSVQIKAGEGSRSPVSSPLAGIKLSVADSTISDSELAATNKQDQNHLTGVSPTRKAVNAYESKAKIPHTAGKYRNKCELSGIRKEKKNAPHSPSPEFSPRRLSLDERIKLELGSRDSPLPQLPPSQLIANVPTTSQPVNGQKHQLSTQPPQISQQANSVKPFFSNVAPPINQNFIQRFQSPLLPNPTYQIQNYNESGYPVQCYNMSSNSSQTCNVQQANKVHLQVMKENSNLPPSVAPDWSTPEAFIGKDAYSSIVQTAPATSTVVQNPPATSKVVQVGNVLQVVPVELPDQLVFPVPPPTPPPSQKKLRVLREASNLKQNVQSSIALTPRAPTPVLSQKVIQAGNVLEVIPTAEIPSLQAPPSLLQKPVPARPTVSVSITSPSMTPPLVNISPIPVTAVKHLAISTPPPTVSVHETSNIPTSDKVMAVPSPVPVPVPVPMPVPVVSYSPSPYTQGESISQLSLPIGESHIQYLLAAETTKLEEERKRLEKERRQEERENRRREKELKRQQKLRLKLSSLTTENILKKAFQQEKDVLDDSTDIDLQEMRLIEEAMAEIPEMDEEEESIIRMKKIPKKKRGIIDIAPLPPAGRGILISAGFRDKSLESEVLLRKTVKFADGVNPGEGTSPSGGEDLPSPPPPPRKLPKEKRFKKRKKKKKKALKTLLDDDDDDDEDDDCSPPPPPPGSPPPHLLYPAGTHFAATAYPAPAFVFPQPTGYSVMPAGTEIGSPHTPPLYTLPPQTHAAITQLQFTTPPPLPAPQL